jgi:hypothetical protein
LIQASVASFRHNLKNDFYEEFGGEEKVKEIFESEKKYPKDVLCKASAWYAVTYKEMMSGRQEAEPEEDAEHTNNGDEWAISDATLLSFPWIVAPLLAHIKTSANKGVKAGKTKELQDISRLITIQAETLFFGHSVREDMKDDFEMRQAERDRLCDEICVRSGKRLIPMPLLGASMTGLNIRDKNPQPLQLYAHATNTERPLLDLLEYQNILMVLHMVDKNSIYLDRALPAVYFVAGDLQHSITTNTNELLKSVYIYLHIQRCPRLLHLLLVIMHWGRKRHMTGSAKESFMPVEDLAVLFISFCTNSNYIEEVRKKMFVLLLNKCAIHVINLNLGSMVFSFKREVQLGLIINIHYKL